MAQTKPKAGQFYGVSGNGTAGQVLISDGNGGMSWGANTENVTVSWNTPTGQSLTYDIPSPQSSSGAPGSAFPTTTFTATKSGEEISGTATIAGLPTGITATQSLSGSGTDNILTVTLSGVFPGADLLNTALTLSGLTVAVPLTVYYLVVAGGGSGGGGSAGSGGAGGAGGLLTNYAGTALTLAKATPYPVTVGAGAATGGIPSNGNNGSNSVFSNITSTGGGAGGYNNSLQATSGGSGGGGHGANGANGSPGAGNTPSTSPSQGNTGGTGNGTSGIYTWAGAGGGGASAVGANASGNSPGNGGIGITNAITVASGTGPYYAGGGGGGSWTAGTSNGNGGTGGGGYGGKGASSAGSGGTPNTGGGGGGGGQDSAGGAGGSGVVILRYPSGFTISGLSGSTDTSITGVKITTFTNIGTGNIQFNLI